MRTSAFIPPLPLQVSSIPRKKAGSSSFVSKKTRQCCPHSFKKCSPQCTADLGGSTAPTTSTVKGLVWAEGRSSEYKVVDAVKEAVSRAASTLTRQGAQADLVLLFVKSRPENTSDDEMRRVIPVLRKSLAMKRLLTDQTQICGCTTSSFVDERDESSVDVVLIRFPPQTVLRPFTLPDANAFDLDWKQNHWHNLVGIHPNKSSEQQNSENLYLFLLQHPDFGAMADLLSGLDFAYPNVRKFGSLAGRAQPLHTAYLFDTNGLQTNGVVALAISSPHLYIDVTVAQGARGVGPVMQVTRVRDGNEICRVREIGTPTQAEAAPMTLLDLWSHTSLISQKDRTYASQYLLCGVEVQNVADVAVSSLHATGGKDDNSYVHTAESELEAQWVSKSEPVDMVIRKVVGFNEGRKSLAIEGGDVRIGSRVQFQIRDEEAARSELRLLLDKVHLEGSSKAMEGMSLMGAILLVDTERGANLYGKVRPDLDRALYSERFPVPLALLTSDGQIGPLPAGGVLGSSGNTFTLSASALYVSIYGPTHEANGLDTPELEK